MRIQVIDDERGEVASVPVIGDDSALKWLELILRLIAKEVRNPEVERIYIEEKKKQITVAPSEPQFRFEVGQRVRTTAAYNAGISPRFDGSVGTVCHREYDVFRNKRFYALNGCLSGVGIQTYEEKSLEPAREPQP